MQHKPIAPAAPEQSPSQSSNDPGELNALLQGVSRSFYLTLRVLPTAVREQIGLAYLLARVADTLADTTALPPSKRLAVLQTFQKQLGGGFSGGALMDIEVQLLGKVKNLDEALLLQQLPRLFALLEQQSSADRLLIEQVLTTLTGGMIFDLNTFPTEESGEVRALQQWDELDRYTYMVAGCVGEFWTAISIAHLRPLRHWDSERCSQLGVHFGKGLQLTNILRDLPRDLRIGRCYLPEALLQRYQLSVETLLDKNNSMVARGVLNETIKVALNHFASAVGYVTVIPRRCVRMRLAALWPLLIGLATLEKLASTAEWLDVNHVVKVKRHWVYRMMAFSLFCVGSNSLIRHWIDRRVKKIMTVSPSWREGGLK